MESIKSILIHQPNQYELAERTLPIPAPGEVRMRVKYAGICGSDSHIYRGHNPFAKYPRVIGHEFFGVIDAVGEGVDKQRIGERVVADPVISCGKCYPCRVGKPNVCTSLVVLGVHRDGGFSQAVCIPAGNAYTVPDEIEDEAATMIEPFSIAANVTGQVNPTKEDIVLIYGAGPMGLVCVQALKRVYQVKQVIVVEKIPERLIRAERCGADLILDTRQLDLTGELKNRNIQPTLIIDSACHPTILLEATKLASPAGRIVIMGFMTTVSEVIQQYITGKELTIYSTRLNAKRFPLVIDWLRNKLIDPSLLITHRFSFEQFEQAISLFEEDQKSCCKVLLSF